VQIDKAFDSLLKIKIDMVYVFDARAWHPRWMTFEVVMASKVIWNSIAGLVKAQ
jgi:hypothetical protein